jgi:hypothetical protein
MLFSTFTITKQDKQTDFEPCSSILKTLSSEESKENKAKRVISIGQLNVLLRLHTQPIKLVVYKHP